MSWRIKLGLVETKREWKNKKTFFCLAQKGIIAFTITSLWLSWVIKELRLKWNSKILGQSSTFVKKGKWFGNTQNQFSELKGLYDSRQSNLEKSFSQVWVTESVSNTKGMFHRKLLIHIYFYYYIILHFLNYYETI